MISKKNIRIRKTRFLLFTYYFTRIIYKMGNQTSRIGKEEKARRKSISENIVFQRKEQINNFQQEVDRKSVV